MSVAISQQCYHCHLPVADNVRFVVAVMGEPRAMCCPGCQAVAESIVSAGLEDFYRYRTDKSVKVDAAIDEAVAATKAFDEAAIQEEFVVEHEGASSVVLTVEGITCAACAWLIEKKLNGLSGLKQVAVNVTARRLTLVWEPELIKLSTILSTLERIGYHALPFQIDSHEASYQRVSKSYLKKLGLSGLMTMQVMMLAIGLYFSLFGYIEPQTRQYFHWVSLILTLPVVIYGGSGFYRNAWNGLKGKTLNMDFSISLAVLGTFAASAWATLSGHGDIYFESVCMFIFLLLVSRYLEHRSKQQAAMMSANMLKYQPVMAHRLINQNIESCLAKQLRSGDLIVVKVGETIPADGHITKGRTDINEAMLTGEFKPVIKQQGDKVYGGSINQSQQITVEVSASVKNTLLNQILRMQEMALSQKPTLARYADRTSEYFVWGVIAIALISYLGWQFVEPGRAFWIAIAVLVATCPCALSLATPSALGCAIGRLNKQGLLLRHADLLEKIDTVDTVIFDKTGTLTQGKLMIKDAYYAPQPGDKQCDIIAASLEAHSEHPIAKAFAQSGPLRAVEKASTTPGFGVEGYIAGKHYRIGNDRFVEADISKFPPSQVYLEEEGKCIAAYNLQDQIRPEVKELLKSVAEKQVWIVSGDTHDSVAKLAQQLGISRFHAQYTPKDKMDFIASLQKQGRRVLMVGDGINDAPVLAIADVSVAVMNASDIAKQSADMILLGNNLLHISDAMTMARAAGRKIKQNVGWALGYNLLILPLAVFGYLTPWMAVIGMSLSSFLVISNSTRLIKYDLIKP